MPIKIHKKQLTDTDKKYLDEDDSTFDNGFVAGNYIKSSQVNAALHQLTIAAKALLLATKSDDTFDATADENNVSTIADAILTNIQSIKVNNATNADTATKLSVDTIGSANMPVYVDDGLLKQCEQYAGGTKVTLNGTNKSHDAVSISAPTQNGTANQTCVMNNDASNPVWMSLYDETVSISADSTKTFYDNTIIYYTTTANLCEDVPVSATYYTSATDINKFVKSATCIVKRSLTSDAKTSYTYHGRIILTDTAIRSSDIWIRLQLSTARTVKYVIVTPTFISSSTLNGNGRTMPYVVCNTINTVYVGKDTSDTVFDGFTFEIVCC